jgi:hypothetical protein
MVTNLPATGVIPADIRSLFGPPPVLATEDPNHYNLMLDQFARCVRPRDIYEWLFLKGAVDARWEIVRLRRVKSGHGGATALQHEQALIIAESEIMVLKVRAARVAAIERRIAAASSAARADPAVATAVELDQRF